jgi:hypothetical protein
MSTKRKIHHVYPDKAERVIESILKNSEKTCSSHASATRQGGLGQRRNLIPNLFARSADRTDEEFIRESGQVRREIHFCRFAVKRTAKAPRNTPGSGMNPYDQPEAALRRPDGFELRKASMWVAAKWFEQFVCGGDHAGGSARLVEFGVFEPNLAEAILLDHGFDGARRRSSRTGKN